MQCQEQGVILVANGQYHLKQAMIADHFDTKIEVLI